MKILYTLFIYLWSAWCYVMISTVALLCFPILVLAVLTRHEGIIRATHFLPTRAARLGLFLCGIKVEIRGKEHIDPMGQYVYISNHRSYLDGVIAGAVIPNFVKFLGKAEMLSWPVVGFLLKHYYVPVWRDDKQHRAWSLAQMEQKIKTGCCFFICPEGTCNITDDYFIHFHSGAFRLAADAHISLVPLTFIGSGERMPRNRFLIHPGKIIVYWHSAIPAVELTTDTIEQNKDKVKAIMTADLLKHYPMGRYVG